MVKEFKLSDRVFKCPRCGLIMDRDLNASLNILKHGGLGASPTACGVPPNTPGVYPGARRGNEAGSLTLQGGVAHNDECISTISPSVRT
uniref:zinc ribbon domain-containing protein n=1 Tax=Vulcanisaeta moutnovskia TaxID=985052 RepID=UPI0011D0EAB3